MVVVHVLAYECVRLDCAVCIHFRHIHVVYEVDQSSAAWGAVVAPSFLLEGLFQYRYVREEWKCKGERMSAEKGVIK